MFSAFHFSPDYDMKRHELNETFHSVHTFTRYRKPIQFPSNFSNFFLVIFSLFIYLFYSLALSFDSVSEIEVKMNEENEREKHTHTPLCYVIMRMVSVFVRLFDNWIFFNCCSITFLVFVFSYQRKFSQPYRPYGKVICLDWFPPNSSLVSGQFECHTLHNTVRLLTHS